VPASTDRWRQSSAFCLNKSEPDIYPAREAVNSDTKVESSFGK
jgi:hypothetical protein